MRKILYPPSGPEPAAKVVGGESPAIQWGRLFVAVVVGVWAAAPVIGFMASLSLLTVVGFAAAFFGFGRPSLGVLGISLLCTLDPLVRNFLMTTGGLLRWNTFNYWLLISIATSAAFVWRVSDPSSKLLKAFIVVLAADLIFSPDRANGVQHVLGAVSCFGLLVYFAQVGEDPDLWYMVGIVNGTVGALGGLAFMLLKTSLPYLNTNVFALFPETAVFAICLAFRSAAAHRRGQVTLGILAGANAMWAFLSGSRGGILIVLVGLIYILVTIKRAAHRVAFIVAAVAITAVALNAFGDMEAKSLQRIGKMLDEDQSAASRTSGRSDLAVAGWYMFVHQPLGLGTGGFAPTWAGLGFIPGLSNFKRGQEFQAHSAWIKTLAENGWPGMLLMVAYVGSFAFFGLRLKTDGSATLGLLVSFALAVSFLSTEFQGKAVWFIAAGATAQLFPAEMARCVSADVTRFLGRPRRLVSQMSGPQQS